MSESYVARVGRERLVWAVVVPAAALVLSRLVVDPSGLRLALAAGGGFALVAAGLRLPRLALMGLVAWLVALGLVRRLTSGVSPKEAWGDPLLLVSAAVLGTLAVLAAGRGAFAQRSRLANAVLALGGLLAASTFNPIQGGLTVGLGGLLLVVVPMVSFLVGRALVDDHLFGRLLWLVAGLSVVSALYGLAQTFVGMPSWDAGWVDAHGYTALNVGGVIRAFASFSAASEYAGFLGIGIVVWAAHAGGFLRWPVVAGAVGLLATALWYESSRGIIVMTIGAIGLMLCARAGLSLGRSLALGVAVLAVLPVVIGYFTPDRFSESSGDRLAQHQVEGLTDPFGETSTLPGHINMVRDGVASAFHDPLGRGVGATTIAGGKYGGTGAGTEADPGNVAVAAGLPGLLAYLVVVVFGFSRLYQLAAQRRDAVSLAALGIAAVTFLQWLNGGQYAVVIWPWLVLGWADRVTPPDPTTSTARDRTAARTMT